MIDVFEFIKEKKADFKDDIGERFMRRIEYNPQLAVA